MEENYILSRHVLNDVIFALFVRIVVSGNGNGDGVDGDSGDNDKIRQCGR
jgi:hypothetical protein